MTVHKNEVYYAELSPVVGSEQGGTRPVLVIQNDIGNKTSPTIIVAAITSRNKKCECRHMSQSQWNAANFQRILW